MKRLLTLAAVLFVSLAAQAQQFYLFVGTYTTGTGKGIYLYRFDAATGKASLLNVTDIDNPSYLTLSPDGRYVYAVNENPPGKGGGVSALAFDSVGGTLKLLNQQSTQGDFPCYVAEDATGKWVTVANYGGGNLCAFIVASDGALGAGAQNIPHEGKGGNPTR